MVVVGAGGIGCPAAWGLAEAGVGLLTLFDPDVVEPSNLPRQVLYARGDIGKSKALVAAERLDAMYPGTTVGYAERLDDTNALEALAGAHVLVDATDGARAKDWLNAVAVRRDLPLIHAAGLRSEGRILDVPAGGRPCLACLFGRLEEEQGGCADLGVWGGVVGAVGFLAAAAALRRLGTPQAPSRGYTVLDLEGGRAVTLGAGPSAECPVCGPDAPCDLEAYPIDGMACDGVPSIRSSESGRRGQEGADVTVLDLVGEVCPLNLLRARQALDELRPEAVLEIRLGAEGRDSVPEGLHALGHGVEILGEDGGALRLWVQRADASKTEAPALVLDRDALLHYARQVVLPEVGEVGQQRLLAAEAAVRGDGAVAETAAVYLRAAGVEALRREEVPDAPAAWGRRSDEPMRHFFSVASSGESGRIVHGDASPTGIAPGGPAARALGALLADTVCRSIVLDRQDAPRIVVRTDGTIHAG